MVNDTDLLLGCDLVVSNDEEVLLTLKPNKTKAIINTDEIITGEFTRDINFSIPTSEIKLSLIKLLGKNNINFIPSTTISKKILGDSMTSNMFIVGLAYKSGFIPISSFSIIEAIKLNKVEIDKNILSFNLGRYSYLKKDEILLKINDNDKKV